MTDEPDGDSSASDPEDDTESRTVIDIRGGGSWLREGREEGEYTPGRVVYQCSMCDYTTEADDPNATGTRWMECPACEKDRLFDPVS